VRLVCSGWVRARPACSRSSMRLRGRVTCMYVWMYVRCEMGGCCVRCLSPCQGLGPLCPASQCQGCAYVHMHTYAYAYALARALALPVRVCVPHLSCLLCSALSSHVPCSYGMSAHARAHAALGADMHMCMGACPAGVVVRSPTASYPISLSDSRGFGSCRVPSSHHLRDGPDHVPITRSYVCHRGFLHPHGCSPATRPL